MGEVDLFFHARANPSSAEGSLLEALGSHLADAMENMRLNSLEKEAAVSQERHLLEEIDVGVRESYGDVRELLLHFRTRTNTEDIERAQRILMLTVSEDESDLAAALRGIARGASNKEIAREHSIAETTVKIHVQHVLRKLDVSSRVHIHCAAGAAAFRPTEWVGLSNQERPDRVNSAVLNPYARLRTYSR